MPTSRSHGFNGYVEAPRADEEPAGVPETEQARASLERKAGGNGIPLGAKVVPMLGGKAHKNKTHLSHKIESTKLDPVYLKRARVLRNALSREIASVLGGGRCGVAASLFLKFAAQKTAAAEQAFAAGDFEAHRKLTESARMDVLYSREHAIKEAAARTDDPAAFAREVEAANREAMAAK